MARLERLLESDERVLWIRRGSPYARVRLAVQVLGHMLLTALSVVVGVSVSPRLQLQVLVGALFWVSSNAPLIIWSLRRRLRRPRSEGDVFFVTDRRVGILSALGGMVQMPLGAGFAMKVSPETVEFGMPGQVPLNFDGLTGAQVQLVALIVGHLLEWQQGGGSSTQRT